MHRHVYICSPYSGNTGKNKDRARDYARQEYESGNIPFAPHLYYLEFMDEDTEREEIMEMCEADIERMDELHVYGERITAGMRQEIDAAERFGIPVLRFEG